MGLKQVGREVRYLASGTCIAGFACVAVAALWLGPFSPAAMDRPAQLVASGQLKQAYRAYVDLAEGWGSERQRSEALYRAAQLAEVELSRPDLATDLLGALVARHPDSEHTADAWAALASLARSDARDPVLAAQRWIAAAKSAPQHSQAGRWMVDAGLAFADAGDLARAEVAFLSATVRPDQAVSAWLEVGRIRLIADPTGAYEAYDAAFQAAADIDARRLARLGMATALEHLDRREQALAELDEAAFQGEDDPALRRRRSRLRARRDR